MKTEFSVDKKIKVQFVISAFAYGAGKVLLDILRYIDRKKIEPALAFLWRKKDEHFNALQQDVRLYDLKAGDYGITTQIPKLARRLKTVIDKENPDVVVSFLWDANVLNILTNKIFTKRHTIICEHTAPEGGFLSVFGNSLKTQLALKVTGFLYSKADSVVAVSQGIKTELVGLGVPEKKIIMTYNPIDFARLNTLKNVGVNISKPYVLYVGQLIKSKNVPLLLDAFSRLEDKKEIILVIVGEGPEKYLLMDMVNKKGLKDRVIFTGYDANPFKYMSNAELLVLPSNTESMGLVILEAMACGCPVISTNCRWGPDEIIKDGVNGFLVPLGDEDAMAHAIDKMLCDKSLREKFVKNSFAKLSDFDPVNQTRRYEELIKSIVGKGD